MCWIGLGSVEVTYSLTFDCGLPQGIMWPNTTYRSLGMQQMSMEVLSPSQVRPGENDKHPFPGKSSPDGSNGDIKHNLHSSMIASCILNWCQKCESIKNR